MDKHIPSKTLTGQYVRKPWIDRKVKAAIRKKREWKDIRKYRHCRSETFFNNPKDKVTILNRQYVSVHTHEDRDQILSPSSSTYPDRDEIQLQKKEFWKCSKKTNPRKATDPDSLPDRSKALLLLWFLTVTCSCCPYLYFGSAIMLVTYFVNFR